MVNPPRHSKATSIALGCAMLIACTQNIRWIQGDSSELWGDGKLPTEWEFVSCPSDLPAFAGCDFGVPLHPNDDLEVENIDSDYFWLSGLNSIDATFQIISYHRSDYLEQSLQEILNQCQSNPKSTCPQIKYILEKDDISVASYKYGDEFRFMVKTPKTVIIVSDPSFKTGPTITPENVALLEKTILNIRLNQ